MADIYVTCNLLPKYNLLLQNWCGCIQLYALASWLFKRISNFLKYPEIPYTCTHMMTWITHIHTHGYKYFVDHSDIFKWDWWYEEWPQCSTTAVYPRIVFETTEWNWQKVLGNKAG